MIKKRITLSDWTYIGKHNVCYKWAQGFCDYYLLLDEDGALYRQQNIKPWFYAILFVPYCIFMLAYCIIDGGLVEFEVPQFTLEKYYLGMSKDNKYGISYKKAKEIWNKYDKGSRWRFIEK